MGLTLTDRDSKGYHIPNGSTGSSDINQSGVIGFANAARGMTSSNFSGIGDYGLSTEGYGVY